MPDLADIAFECPICKGPLMAESAHVGMSFDCPHCFSQLEVPTGDQVNKDRFVEPSGLRRVLKEVRDREWEILRRKLKASHARTVELEADLHRVQAALAEKAAAQKIDEKGRTVEALQEQMTSLNDKFNQANLAFMASRKQQDTVIEHLRRELENSRGEGQVFKKKNEELARQLHSTLQRYETARLAVSMAEDIPQLQADLATAHEALAESQRKLEAEQAKVVLMEAAAMTVAAPENVEDKNAELLKELQLQVAELRKENKALRGARDRANSEAAECRRKEERERERADSVHAVLGQLEGSLRDVLTLAATRHAKKQSEA